MQKGFRRYVTIWAALSSLVLSGVAGLNLAVDPFRVHQTPPAFPWKPFRDIRGRAGKAELIRQGGWDTILIGSSRAENGFDSAHPAWGSPRVLNAGLGGPNLYEVGYIFRYIVQQEAARRIVLCIDFLMFDERLKCGQDFAQSRFDPTVSEVDYRLGHLFGSRATTESYETLCRWRDGIYPMRTDQGFRVWQRRVWRQAHGHRYRFNQVIKEYVDPKDVRSYYGYQYGQSRLDLFAEMVATARARKIALMVVIPPAHAEQLETMQVMGVWDTFERWKRDLVNVLRQDREQHPDAPPIPLWDFTGYCEILSEPVPTAGDTDTEMRWFWECSHFRKELGDLAIERMMSGTVSEPPTADFGACLTAENIDQHLDNMRADRERYARAHADEIANIERLARAAEAGAAK